MASSLSLQSHLCAFIFSVIVFYASSTLATYETILYPVTQISDGQIQAPADVATASLILTFTPESAASAQTATLSSLPASLITAIPSSNVTATAPALSTGPVPTSILLASVPPQLAALNATGPTFGPPVPIATGPPIAPAGYPTTMATVPSVAETSGETTASPGETELEATSVGSAGASYTGPAASDAVNAHVATPALAVILPVMCWFLTG